MFALENQERWSSEIKPRMVGWSKGGVDSLSLERRSLSKSGKSIGTSLGKEGSEGEETCETTSTVEGVADAIADNPAAAS